MHLTHQELSLFNVFGFLRLRNLFSADEVVAFRREAIHILNDDAVSHPYDGTERQQIQGFVEHSDQLRSLITEPRVLLPARQILGEDLIWIGSDGNRYVGDTGWHPDGSSADLRRVKFAFYLETLTASSGALRVVPGSHEGTLHERLRVLLQREDETITPYGVRASRRADTRQSGFGIPADVIPCIAVENEPGDVVAFDQNLWHASFGGKVGRMMFTLNYATYPTNDAAKRFAVAMNVGQTEHIRTRQWGKRTDLYPSAMYGSTNPEMIHLMRFWMLSSS